MKTLLEAVSSSNSYKEISKRAGEENVYVVCQGQTEKAFIISGLAAEKPFRVVYIAANELKAIEARNEFLCFFPGEVLYLPPKELLLHSVEARSRENEFERISTLVKAAARDYRVLIMPVRALADIIYRPEKLIKNTFAVSTEYRGGVDGLAEQLAGIGYKREALVEGRGQFARRGDIVDVFPVNAEEPVRIEFFGDEAESVRSFDPASQRSVQITERVVICPAREILLNPEEKKELAGRLKLEMHHMSDEARIRTGSDAEKLEQDIYINGIDKYTGLVAENGRSVLGHIGEALLAVDDVERFEENYTAVFNEVNEEIRGLFQSGILGHGMAVLINDLADTYNMMERFRKISFGSVERAAFGKALYFGSRPVPSYKGDTERLKDDIGSWRERGFRVYAAVSNQERKDRLRELLGYPENVGIFTGDIRNGFEIPDDKTVVLSEKTLFDIPGKRQRYSRRDRDLRRLSGFSDINSGDLVVHRIHGIGIYEGIRQLEVEDIKKDYIKIRYRDGGILYVPAEQLDSIQKYIGSDDSRPRINRLGSGEWSRAKRKVKESLVKLAKELAELYAKRQKIKGYAFAGDTAWQEEFEDKFPYTETEDQLTCAEEIKKDMERELPMDRILCGDVGYGKTEVAVRAMFKAVSDSFQVAYLVPTTVLAQQQYNNLVERFSDYPVRIEMLSRFKTAARQKEIVRRTKRGHVDILIATHRMLSSDISFKKLGLLVVDEEHRFGVKHKEKIKEKYPEIDVLTLTATPIPRTLHMSMAGIRDISVINMPPEERYPVQTYVMEYDKDIIRNAVYRELARGGQVYYIHNRVRDMDLQKDRLRRMIPEARIETAHGQMSERELEHIMEAFVNKDIDVLLCTTIIESGMDISNANTIVIEDADNYGLAQLYQLKGRVGRSERHAYAYVTYRKDRVLNETSEKRLNAIREFTEFGAGFRIALRDLEIRGAGNILGPEQHGQMEAVGYDMYCRLLEEAVSDMKGFRPSALRDTEIKLDIKVSAYIDDHYIPDTDQKIDMYKKIAEIRSGDDMDDLKDELQDRYGEVPDEILNLMETAYIKNLASGLGFESIRQGKGEVVFRFAGSREIDLRIIPMLAEEFRDRVMFSPSSKPYLTLKYKDTGNADILDNIKVLLHSIYKLKSGS